MPKGVLVAIEGIDGAGKTTQAAALATTFGDLGVTVVRTKEPTDGQYGQRIRATATTGRLPLDEELELFLLDRKEHVESKIAPALDAGALVIVDRYYYSTAAYQGVRGMDPDEIIARNEAFAPRPDLLVILDLPADEGVRRVRARDTKENLFERTEDLRRCRAIFERIEGDHVLRLDGRRPVAELTAAIVRAVLEGPYGLRELAAGGLDDPAWRAKIARELSARR